MYAVIVSRSVEAVGTPWAMAASWANMDRDRPRDDAKIVDYRQIRPSVVTLGARVERAVSL